MSALTALLCGRLREVAESPGGGDEEAVCEVLRALLTCPMSVEALQATKVGLLVNSLRRRLKGEGAALAKRLLDRWKADVAHTATATAPSPGPPSSASQATAAPTSSPASSASPPPPKRRRSSSPTPSLSPPPRSVPPSSSSLLSPLLPLPRYSLADLPGPPSPSPALAAGRSASSASAPAAASAAAAATEAAPPPQGDDDLPLYNPNQHWPYLPSSSASSSATTEPSTAEVEGEDGEAAYVGDATSRKRTQAAGDLAEELALPPPPSHPVRVCSLVQLCVDRLSHPSRLPSLRSLGAIPPALALSVLSRASAEQLTRIEGLNPHLREDLEPLWKALAAKRWGDEAGLQRQREELQATWRELFAAKTREGADRVARVGQRLRAKGEEERKERRERQAVKVMDPQQARRSLQQQRERRRGAVANGGGGALWPSAPAASRAVHRLSQLRKVSSEATRLVRGRPPERANTRRT